MPEREIETAGATVAPAPLVAAAPASLPARVTHQAALARALAAGAPVSNRGVVRVLAREDADLGIVDPWAHDHYSSEPAPAQSTASAPAQELGSYFRAEIIKWLEKFAAAPSLEGKGTGFDELLGSGSSGPERTRKSFNNYTTCNDTTIQIFAKAATLVNVKAGYKLPKKPEFKYIGVVRRASDFGAPEIAKQGDAWVDAGGGGHPEKGDLVLFVNAKGGTYPEHIGFYYGQAATKTDPNAKPPPDPDGADVWMTIDGGQGKKGRWDEKLKDAEKNPMGYVAGSAAESILKRERWHLKDGRIEGEPNQPGGYKKVLGWVKVDKLIDAARIPAARAP